MERYPVQAWTRSAMALSVLIGMATVALGDSPQGENPMAVSAGKQVAIEYTLQLEDKSVLDTNVGGDPLTFTQGSHQIIPGLEDALEGLKTGDTKKVTVKPEDGYGLVDDKAFMEVSKERIPPDAMEVGTQLQGTGPHGTPVMARVTEVKESTVVLDFNHPLAGKTLYFDIKILGVQESSQDP